MQQVLSEILQELFQAHMTIDQLRARNVDLEAQTSVLAAMQRGELPPGWRLVKDRDLT